MTTTLYFLTPPATDSIANLSEDAERRARERGCECPRPEFRHVIAAAAIYCVVSHTAAWCPLAAAEGVPT